MSVLSNRADGAAESAEQYITAVLALLGDADPLEVLGSTAGFCQARTDGLDDGTLRSPESPGKWSAAALLQHLADSELVWGYRLRRVVSEDRPKIEGFDQDLWAERLGYAEADVATATRMFAVLRESNLDLIRSLGPEELSREGVHAERGGESISHMVRLYAGHDLAHRAQLDRILEVVQ